jgi:stage II sporulation protein D
MPRMLFWKTVVALAEGVRHVMRPPAALIAAALAALALAATAGGVLLPPAGSAPFDGGDGGTTGAGAVFVLTGSGYGHGAGMSQYGAFAQARAGRAASDILGFYYPGTQLGHKPATTKLRVLVATGAKTLAVSSTAAFSVRDAEGQSHPLPAGAVTLGSELQVPVDGAPVTLSGPVTFTPGTGQLLSLGGRSYRGAIEVTALPAGLQAVDVVGLDAYVQSVVPSEMPSTWPAAALQAQAIAARSYALAARVQGKAWDLYSDARSQQYVGAVAETPETTAAVKQTAGRVLLYDGAVATTVYSSSSGGRTQSGLDAFGLDVPYLPGQADPWDSVSPFHTWQPRTITPAQLMKALGLHAPVTDVQARFSPSERVVSLTVGAADGSAVAFAGGEVRRRLALRSTAFHLATLRFITPAAATTPGAALRLAGVARDAEHAALERRTADGTWTPVVRRLQVTAAGTFAAVVHPTETTTYRLSASGLPGPALTIPVVGTQS